MLPISGNSLEMSNSSEARTKTGDTSAGGSRGTLINYFADGGSRLEASTSAEQSGRLGGNNLLWVAIGAAAFTAILLFRKQ
jgi:hypothetical protein